MALAIKNIPVLEGKAAERFISNAEFNEQNYVPHTTAKRSSAIVDIDELFERSKRMLAR